jgi:tRNA dimethylallyltransferase
MSPATRPADPAGQPAAPAEFVVVLGATGTGKSELALELAEHSTRRGVVAEIVNADAMQLYRGMDIGTAKLPVAARRGIAHHLLDVLTVRDEASVAEYQTMARATIADILDRGRLPILVGGSGLYISSVLYPFTFPGRDPAIRARIEAEAEHHGTPAMFARLTRIDPVAAVRIGPHNERRIIRALEVAELSGGSTTGALPDTTPWRPFRALGLRRERSELVARLDARVLGMWRSGLLAEVETLIDQGLDEGATARRAIGYAQARAQLAGELTEAEAIVDTQASTRRYARRQVSWFRRYQEISWLDASSPSLAEEAVAAAGIPWWHEH